MPPSSQFSNLQLRRTHCLASATSRHTSLPVESAAFDVDVTVDRGLKGDDAAGATRIVSPLERDPDGYPLAAARK
jgi:hypothetical protein